MNPFQRLLFFFNVIALELKTIFTDAINHNQIKFIFFRVQYYVTYYMEVVFIVYQSSTSTKKRLINPTPKLYKFHLMHDLKVCNENIKID